MSLIQFNVDVDPALKKKVRMDCAEFEINNAVVANTIFEEFFRRHPQPEDRAKLYRKMKAKLEAETAESVAA